MAITDTAADLDRSAGLPRIFYRPREAAAVAGLSPSRIYELMAAGQLEYRQVGSVRLIPRTSLEALGQDSEDAR